MKRSAALTPLSREHHHALSLAIQAGKAARTSDPAQWQQAAAKISQQAEQTLQAHFAEEERTLLPALTQAGQALLAQRTLDEHVHLRQLLQHAELASPAILQAFADAMTAHVRFEERELFAVAESLPAVMAALQAHTT
ncbi:hemerythrin HHE cation-binding protein [Aquitalea sp. FJL05]|uniref:hemerythrin domain-containing protein n=1 Tax=Aquitalea TaxID=407217 RepID=UPI000F5A43DD|nr:MULTISPECIES: hemerythrin domain-containing protein [Aquitalea]RQO78349.1 hemerythrin HHE cation-binding protein [Aquitalea sp. FJL05]